MSWSFLFFMHTLTFWQLYVNYTLTKWFKVSCDEWYFHWNSVLQARTKISVHVWNFSTLTQSRQTHYNTFCTPCCFCRELYLWLFTGIWFFLVMENIHTPTEHSVLLWPTKVTLQSHFVVSQHTAVEKNINSWTDFGPVRDSCMLHKSFCTCNTSGHKCKMFSKMHILTHWEGTWNGKLTSKDTKILATQAALRLNINQ